MGLFSLIDEKLVRSTKTNTMAAIVAINAGRRIVRAWRIKASVTRIDEKIVGKNGTKIGVK